MGYNPVVPAVAPDDPQGQVCAICMDTVDDGESMATVNPCTHQFHGECLDMWVATLVDRRELQESHTQRPATQDRRASHSSSMT